MFESKRGMRGYMKTPYFAVVLLLLAGVFFYGTARMLPATADEEKTPPLATTVVPKHRLNISYMTNGFKEIKTFRGQNAEVKSGTDLVVSGSVSSTDVNGMAGATPDDDHRVFAMASTAGKITKTVTLDSADFYGVSQYDGVESDVRANVYLVLTGNEDANTSALYIEIFDKSGSVAKVNLSSSSAAHQAVMPAYKYKFKADGSWTDAPALSNNVCQEIVANDWNNDGFSDYVITYVANENGKAYGDKKDCAKVALAYVDGKSLFESKSEITKVTTYTNKDSMENFSETSDVVGGLTDTKPASSMRMALGDFNHDGTKEIAVYHTRTKSATRYNRVFVYSVKPADSSVFQKKYTNDSDVGHMYLRNDSVGIAAGDIDNDGRDEIVCLYANTSVFYDYADLKISVLRCTDSDFKTWNVAVSDKEIGIKTYDCLTDEISSYPPIDTALADMDDDGFPELVWYTGIHTKDRGSWISETILGITKWNQVTDDKGKVSLEGYDKISTYDYNLYKYVDGRVWKLEDEHLRYSMAVGSYRYIDANTTTSSVNGKPQIAVVELQASTNGSKGMIFWGVIDKWSADGGISFLHNDSQQVDDAAIKNVRPVVVAADLDDESMLLGSPACLSITDNVEVLAYVQAPPRHYDVISGDLNSGDYGEGSCVADAFSQLSTYNTAMNWDKSESAFKSTTNSNGFDIGGSVNFSKSKKSAISAMSYKAWEYCLNAKANFNWTDTDDKSLTISTQTSATTGPDDDLYCRVNDIDLWRYPILYPESMRTTTSGDVTLQNYVQISVPVETTDTFTPSTGRKVDWYEPMHDNFNLFTYPIELDQITGYPRGEADKSADDPYKDLNGQVFVKGEHQQMGNPGASSYSLSIKQETGSESDYTWDLTIGLSGYWDIQWASVRGLGQTPEFQYDVIMEITGDYCHQHDSLTTTDASKVQGMTVNWSNALNYANKGGFTLEDQTFYSDIAIFTQDDGGFCIGYTVNELKNTSSKLWGNGSPYNTSPDPALCLPFRWTYEGRANEGINRGFIRGLTLKQEDSTAGTFSQDGTPGKLLDIGTSVDATIRIFNCSFVDSAPISVDVRYQKIESLSDEPDWDKATVQVATKTITGIAGRPKSGSATQNWEELHFDWDGVPTTEQMGYLHVKLGTSGAQLNTANDWGCTLVGFMDKDALSSGGSSSASSSSVSAAQYPDLSLSGITAYAYDDGVLGEKLDLKALPTDRRFLIKGSVDFSSGRLRNGRTVNYAPMIYVAMLGGNTYGKRAGGVLGGKYVPVVKAGDSWNFELEFDPASFVKQPVPKKVEIRTFSRLLGKTTERDLANNSYVLWDRTSSGSGSSGGCSAGLGGLGALLAIALLALADKRKK